MKIKPIFKVITAVSAISGAITGIAALLPFLSFCIFCLLMLGMAPYIIIYLKNLHVIGNLDTEQSLIYGGLSGFMGFLGFSVTFFPLAFIIDLIFKTETFLWVNVVFKNFGFLLTMVILTALLSALLNMFSGFLTGYIYQYLKK